MYLIQIVNLCGFMKLKRFMNPDCFYYESLVSIDLKYLKTHAFHVDLKRFKES